LLQKLIENIAKNETTRLRLQLVMTFCIYVIIVFTIIILFDKLIIPYFVHDKPKVIVPNIKGANIEVARQQLSAKNLRTEEKEQFNKLPAGTVISQTPEPGREVKSNRPIFLVVSKGSKQVKIPYVIGLKLSSAKSKIESEGITVANSIPIFDEYMQAGIVVRLSKQPETLISSGDTITIFYSKGKEVEEVLPNFVSLSLDEAKAMLSGKNVTFQVIKKREETFIENTVIEQSPVSGTSITDGMVITLTVSEKK
jgi:serine/threonine-protein kinase